MGGTIVLQIDDLKETHQLTAPCIIGRGEDAHLKIPDETISHRHALISEEFEQTFIQDLGSRNGILINGARVEGKSPLTPGDSIQLGRVAIRYLRVDTTAEAGTVILHSSDAATEWDPDRHRLRWIYEMTLELSEHMDSPSFGNKVHSRLKEVFRFDQCYMAIIQEDGSFRAALTDASPEDIPISRTIVDRLLQNGESFILADALSEDSMSMQESVVSLRIRSAMCVPLIYRDNIYGLIYLACDVPGVYTQVDLEYLKTIAAILGPKIENARLLAQIRGLYDNAVETLRKTESRLMTMERARAYVWLAQAMAHEIRNPLMVIGGLARRMAQQGQTDSCKTNVPAILASVERVEAVLREVDSFVSLPAPNKKPERIDNLIRGEIESCQEFLEKSKIRPILTINTSRLKIPLDGDLLRKAVSLILREVPSNIAVNSELKISIQDSGNDIEIYIGPEQTKSILFEALDADHAAKPSSLGLFLNLAYKVISEQGGELLLDPQGHSPFPMLIRLPRIS
jgi:two-component system, NtrC family, sensor kinase